MTTLSQDKLAPSQISPAPNAQGGIHEAGDVGPNWFDFSGPAAISSLLWERTISTSDEFVPGTILFSLPVSPSAAPEDAPALPIAAHFSSVFLQMVFDKINYELIASKGSLTNAKLCLAFLPDTKMGDLDDLTKTEIKYLVDRQAEKIIFSPNANLSQVLSTRWSHKTNFASTAESMGIVLLMLYQKVVGNIADGGTNEIHLSIRQSVTGLKLRFPTTPYFSHSPDAFWALKDIYTPQQIPDDDGNGTKRRQIRQVLDVPLPTASINVVTTPTMVALPPDIANELDATDVSQLIKPTGQRCIRNETADEIFQLSSRSFYNNAAVADGVLGWGTNNQPYAEEMTQLTINLDHSFPVDSNPTTDEYGIDGSFPFQNDTDTIITSIPDSPCEYMIIDELYPGAFKGSGNVSFEKSSENPGIMTFHITSMFCDSIGIPQCLKQINKDVLVATQNTNGTPRLKRLYLWTRDGLLQETIDEGLPDLEIQPGEAAVLWSQVPQNVDPVKIISEIADGAGLPLIGNLANQEGANTGGRIEESFSADMAVGITDELKGVEEIIGTVVSTVENFLPFLSLLIKETALVVEATRDSPIHYVDVGGANQTATKRNSAVTKIKVRDIRETIRKLRLRKAAQAERLQEKRYHARRLC